MPSSKTYLSFILEQLSELQEISYRAMMNEFILYYRGKIIGGVYDDRLLLKPTKAALALLPDCPYTAPYPGAKELLLIEEVDDKKFLTALCESMYDELPAPKIKKEKRHHP